MKIGINDLKKGSLITFDNDSYAVLSVKHLHMGRGGAVIQTKLRNLRNGKILDRNFKSGDNIEEINLIKFQAIFIYHKGSEYWFHKKGFPAKRFSLEGEALGEKAGLLKPEMEILALQLLRDDKEQIISIELPIKADYKVTHAPPGIRGSTAQGGTKTVTIEGGLKINTPLFIEEGDMIRINTETMEYAERV